MSQGPLNERHDESDIGDEKQRQQNDMKHKIRARTVIARITFPLPAKQARNAHVASDCVRIESEVFADAPRQLIELDARIAEYD